MNYGDLLDQLKKIQLLMESKFTKITLEFVSILKFINIYPCIFRDFSS